LVLNLNSIVAVFHFLNNGKNAKSFPLAPVEVEILISRGSAYKIAAKNGTILTKKPHLSAPNNYQLRN
jgi:hypothetical protein